MKVKKNTLFIVLFMLCVHQGISQHELKPTSRVYHVLVYDEAVHSTLLLDGYHEQTNPEFGETWAWTGAEWKVHSGVGPKTRGASAAVYDSKRKSVITFGGLHYRGKEEGTTLNDTWEWNGKWTELTSKISPSPRMAHSMAYDSDRGVVVLFGGRSSMNSPAFGDTWELNNGEWKKIEVTGPTARADAAMAYDPIRKKVVLFGGSVNSDMNNDRKDMNDTWTWDGQSWQKVNGTVPAKRIRHHMAFDNKNGNIILYGGDSVAPQGEPIFFDDMWKFDGTQWTRIPATDSWPGRRFLHAMAYDTKRNRLILYGGANGETILNDIWEWDGKWKVVHPSPHP